ncbi:histidine phosphatase family protein [Streptomyces thinghirensis]|nr:histidine phosphatase family protein [Streptomyces thinghirensis]
MTDHERPLADRGRKDAAEAGRRLADTGIPFDQALCSTSIRTRETWKLAVHEFPAAAENRLRGADLRGLARRADRRAQRDPRRPAERAGDRPQPGHGGDSPRSWPARPRTGRERMGGRGFPTAAFAVLTFTGSWKDVEPGAASLADYWAPTD